MYLFVFYYFMLGRSAAALEIKKNYCQANISIVIHFVYVLVPMFVLTINKKKISAVNIGPFVKWLQCSLNVLLNASLILLGNYWMPGSFKV